ncbi:MAG: ribonuclease III [Myxococcales bacterium]|nr:ribonuclease III [Myxococcales bacterium]
MDLPPDLDLDPRAHPLLEEALTHRTWLNEHKDRPGDDNQRLELLGDAVLGLVIAEALYHRLPRADEGLLSRARAAVVQESSLAATARRVGLGAALRLGRGEIQSGGRDRDGILADAFEAVVGALYLSLGLEETRAFVARTLGEVLEGAVADAERGTFGGVDARVKDAKSILQEIVQRDGGPPPVYEHDAPEGPVHDRTFSVAVHAFGRVLGRGQGKSRREAEKRAATAAVQELGDVTPHKTAKGAAR